MKESFQEALVSAENLLTQSGYTHFAKWFADRIERVSALQEKSDGLRQIALDVNNMLVGMGSFSDLSLEPLESSGLSLKEATDKQWDITARLGEITKKIIHSS